MTTIINRQRDDSMLSPLPKLFDPEKPCFIMASGPSMENVGATQFTGLQHITVNETWRKFNHAQVQFSIDSTWWTEFGKEYREKRPHQFAARSSWNVENDKIAELYKAALYRQSRSGLRGNPQQDFGFDTTPGYVRGNNSGAVAINLAWHLGARLIILLGFDMRLVPEDQPRPDYKSRMVIHKRIHWYNENMGRCNPNEGTFTRIFIPCIESMAPEAEAAGCRIVNCTPDSALTCFERGYYGDYLK